MGCNRCAEGVLFNLYCPRERDCLSIFLERMIWIIMGHSKRGQPISLSRAKRLAIQLRDNDKKVLKEEEKEKREKKGTKEKKETRKVPMTDWEFLEYLKK
jgi:hypothetical protein